ncbi:alpha/beta fold hydrolase [Rothia kristinae]|uniref:alpha/beta fold hydrolase n=1 Tax=Rothia kristinae TaxID=37923 RepID=UPI0021A61FE0|nr:alpha/beta hydrolase [Rothia kristinae]MCT1357854.1 alpha/beta fold hydrolase [Rothia kristinae]MCT1393579.1 alpha/beta fold hydrolase [Rothia kristinae]MCT1505482.1 alpha/beta fold hydrolase [Rothia kristinae]MCT2038658.1 alpha/beta fold hydrolase [Rothia kristinae]MCT2242743.1 alpha/beta fold hydrolase [Rothia kristinae]
MLRARARHSQGRREWVTTRDGRELCAMVIDGPRCGAAEAAGAVCPRPTVIVEADAADTGSMWALVQRTVGVSARTVVYDRTGLGRSAGSGRRPAAPWTLERMTADLEDLLEHFGPGPFVLVGHGTGGPVVRAVAARRRERISGLVLVDPVDELGPAPTQCRLGPVSLGSLMSPESPESPRRGLSERRRPRWAAALSGTADAARRLAALARHGRCLHLLPEDVRADLAADGWDAASRTASAQLRASLDETLRGWLDQSPKLGRIPVTVISAGRREARQPARLRAALTAAHARRAGATCHGRHVILPGVDGVGLPVLAAQQVAAEIRALAGCLPGRRAYTPHPWRL